MVMTLLDVLSLTTVSLHPNVVHLKAIDVMFQSIIDCLLQAGEDVMHEYKSQERQIIWWNHVCKEVHAAAREALLN